MTSHTTKAFRKLLIELPPEVQRQARSAYRIFLRDPWHASLQLKQVHSVKPIYSVRIGLDYRAVCIRSGEVCIWFFIGTHASYDRLR